MTASFTQIYLVDSWRKVMSENTVLEQHDSRQAEGKSVRDDAARQASQSLYADVNSNRSDASAVSIAVANPNQNIKPDGFSAIPPYLLEEMSKRTGNQEYLNNARTAEEMQSHGDVFRPRNSATEDSMGKREVYNAKGQNSLPGEHARFEGEKPTGVKEEDDVYDFTGLVRDFYSKEYNRNSIDGNGMKFISTVDYRQDPSKPFNNAFWNGSQMAYGRPDDASPFKTFVLLDVTAHEITHGVTEKEGGFAYFLQSGALNESMSDVYGELIKQYSMHQTADQANWLVGDGIWKDSVKGKALRDMLNPGTAYDDPKLGKDPQPADMAHYVTTWKDNGGVHINSGIPNRAFALFAKAVGGYAWDDPGHIWFEARKNAGSTPDFASFAYQTIEAAKRLGHADEVDKLTKAWETVGVTPSESSKATDPTQPYYEEVMKQAGKAA
jgi:Zn-dependent metalloprotease